jgi:hypothetical protein
MNALFKALVYAACCAGLVWLGQSFGSAYIAATNGAPEGSASNALGFFLAYLIIGTVLGLMVAWDATRWIGGVVERILLDGRHLSRTRPLVRKAEQLMDSGETLESVRTLREHLESNPKDWQIAVRIAQIYAGPLHNPTAAILEYEDILRLNLPRETRGQIMLRLFKLLWNQSRNAQAVTLLDRVLTGCPGTLAAAKARRLRQRLSAMERGGAD